MFDIGIFELLVVGGVSLVVIGPERLPGAIRTGALWIGRLKRTMAQTRREIEQQIGADDIRRQLHNEEIMASLEQLRKAREQFEQDIQKEMNATTIEHMPDDNALTHDMHESMSNDFDENQNNPVHAEDTHKNSSDTPTIKP